MPLIYDGPSGLRDGWRFFFAPIYETVSSVARVTARPEDYADSAGCRRLSAFADSNPFLRLEPLTR